MPKQSRDPSSTRRSSRSRTHHPLAEILFILTIFYSIDLAGLRSAVNARLAQVFSHTFHQGSHSLPITTTATTTALTGSSHHHHHHHHQTSHFSTHQVVGSPGKTMGYEKELKIAQLAVARAAILTKTVFREKAKGTVSKDDKSPVTIGDFGAQALIIAAVKHNFPSDQVVGEEEASTLREDKELSSKIWNLVKDVKLDDEESDGLLGGPIKSEDDMLNAIDQGNSTGGDKGRIWALDPIDGTKGFLRGGQYAVCLGLMVDGDVKVGVLGCPNLPVDDAEPLAEDIGAAGLDVEGKGVLFSAVQGDGASSQPLTRGAVTQGKPISVAKITDVSQAVLCESVEAGHSSKGDNAQIAEKLGITGKPVQMDSQAKYGSVARGAGSLYLRLPVRKDYVEKIWDHAAGDLIVREAGGQVTDVNGNRLNFSLGRTLKENKGVVAAPASIHATALKAVQEVLAAK